MSDELDLAAIRERAEGEPRERIWLLFKREKELGYVPQCAFDTQDEADHELAMFDATTEGDWDIISVPFYRAGRRETSHPTGEGQ